MKQLFFRDVYAKLIKYQRSAGNETPILKETGYSNNSIMLNNNHP